MVSLCVHDWEVRKGLGDPESQRKRGLKRRRDREDRKQKCHRQGESAGRQREGTERKQSQSLEGRESRTSHPSTLLNPIPLPFAGSLRLLEGAGWGGILESLLLTPALLKDRAPKQTNILFCAEKCT